MDSQLIEDFSKKHDKTKVQEFYKKMLEFISRALSDLKEMERQSITLKEDSTRIFPMGDYTNDTFIDESGELEVVIATSNPQIAFANQNLIKQLAKKEKNQNLIKDGSLDKIIEDFATCLAQYFGKNTVILLVNDGIKVLCYEEFGFKLLIRFATYSENDENAILYFWDPILKRITKTDLFLYNENMEIKDTETSGNYKKMVRIFKNIRKNMLINKWARGADLNKYFIELIIYNVPNTLLMGDLFKAFVKTVNYLENCDAFGFKSFDGGAVETFSLAKISNFKINNFLNMLSKFVD